VESGGIPDNSDNQCFALKGDMCHLRSKPNRFVIDTAMKPRLIQGYNVMSGSPLLPLRVEIEDN
jgi:hypothetical protein